MRRLFLIWNRGYKTQHVFANDAEEALAISQASGHTRKSYRRFRDITDEWAQASEVIDHGHEERLKDALTAGLSGVGKFDVDLGWTIDGKPTWDTEARPTE